MSATLSETLKCAFSESEEEESDPFISEEEESDPFILLKVNLFL